jgi:hypothetical protein
MVRDSLLIGFITLTGFLLSLQLFCEAQADDESLVMHFPLDEGRGGTAEDHSAFQNNGSLEGAEWVDGKLGKALRFDGKSFVGVMPGQEVSIGTATTWALWFKTDAEGQSAHLAALHGTMIISLSGGNISAQVWTNPGTAVWNTVNSNVRAKSGEWYHVAATWTQESGEITIYVNGEKENSVPAAGAVSFKSGRQLAIGGNDQLRYPGQSLFDGIIDDVRIYNRALSENEVKELFSALAVFPETKLTVTWGKLKK